MNHLLDKKIKRKKFLSIFTGVVFVVVLFYFRTNVFNGLSFVSHKIFNPVLIVGNNIKGKIGNIGSYFSSKNSLYKENEDLRTKLSENQALMSNYNSIVAENTELKKMLGRGDEQAPTILATILEKPNQSLYDTIVVDVGLDKGIKEGSLVFVPSQDSQGLLIGSVPIGKVADVYSNSSKVILFSTSGEKTQVIVSKENAFMEIIGRGGGNFEMILPRDFTLQKGDQVVLPGITPRVLGVVETIISDPRDSFIKALLVSPMNIQDLKFVEVEK